MREAMFDFPIPCCAVRSEVSGFIRAVQKKKTTVRSLDSVLVQSWPIYDLTIWTVGGNDLFGIVIERINAKRNSIKKYSPSALNWRIFAKRQPRKANSRCNTKCFGDPLAFESHSHIQGNLLAE